MSKTIFNSNKILFQKYTLTNNDIIVISQDFKEIYVEDILASVTPFKVNISDAKNKQNP